MKVAQIESLCKLRVAIRPVADGKPRQGQAAGEAPVVRLAAEAAKGGALPATALAGDYGWIPLGA
jgi:hypothetical protein